MAQLTVDLSADKATLARIAQFILQFAGYEPPAVAATPAPAPVIYVDDKGDVQSRVSAEQVESVLGPVVDEIRASQVFAPSPPPRLEAALDVVWPPAAVVPPPPPPAGIDVDLRGLPWDPRIHASTRAKTAEGNWRQKRNVDPELMTKVEAELRATMSAPSPLVAGVGGSGTETVKLPPVVTGRRELAATPPVPPPVPPAPFAASAVPPAPPVNTAAPPASPGAAGSASPGSGSAPSFVQFVHAVTKACTVDKTITQPQVAAALQKFGVASLPLLSARPDLVASVATELGLAL